MFDDFEGQATREAIAKRIDAGLAEVRAELYAAMTMHASMHSPHEGHSVIREELEELWEHVRADTGQTHKARKEALQVAAMGLRYVLDLCPTLGAAAKPSTGGDQFGGFEREAARSRANDQHFGVDGEGVEFEAEPADRGVSSRERTLLRQPMPVFPRGRTADEILRAGPPTPRAAPMQSSAEANNCEQEEGA